MPCCDFNSRNSTNSTNSRKSNNSKDSNHSNNSNYSNCFYGPAGAAAPLGQRSEGGRPNSILQQGDISSSGLWKLSSTCVRLWLCLKDRPGAIKTGDRIVAVNGRSSAHWREYVGGYQNYGPFLDPYSSTAPYI